jgi:hypothetical protein
MNELTHQIGELVEIFHQLDNNDWCFSNVSDHSLRLYVNRRWWLNNEHEIDAWFYSHNIHQIKSIHIHDHSDCMLCECPNLETKIAFVLRWS